MPIKAASFKHQRQTKRRTLRNHKVLSAMNKAVKLARRAISGKSTDVKEKITLAIKSLDSAAQKGIIKRNTAARLKSRISKSLNKKSV